MPYISNTQQQQEEMLKEIGLQHIDDLFSEIPAELTCGPLDIPKGRSELEVRNELERLARQNYFNLTCFLGGGLYDHFIPSAVEAIISRSEFYTAYTPYQPEVSQGTLQAIYEYQSAICRLTEMEVANASLYDGGSAVYEAMMMAMRVTRRNRVIIDDSVNPIYRRMIRSYTANLGIELVEVASHEGLTCREAIEKELDEKTAAVIVQNPNFFGCAEDYADIGEAARTCGALLVVSCYPISLGLLKTPGEMGADIAVGEAQSLGMPLSFGGPYLGFMATRMKYVRKMPGRIIGRTVDRLGRPGYVMTLQAREQHIRREKATSNICTNQGLCALTAIAYLSILGKQGLIDVATACRDRAAYARKRLLEVPGVTLRFPRRQFFNEFVLNLPMAADKVIRRLLHRSISAGFPLARYWPEMNNCLLVAITEKRTRDEIDYLAYTLEVILQHP